MTEKKLTPREVFDKYRSMYAMLRYTDEYYVEVQICGFYRDRFIVAYRSEEGAIDTVKNYVLFDEGYFDGEKAHSYDIVDMSQLKFIDIHATDRIEH